MIAIITEQGGEEGLEKARQRLCRLFPGSLSLDTGGPLSDNGAVERLKELCKQGGVQSAHFLLTEERVEEVRKLIYHSPQLAWLRGSLRYSTVIVEEVGTDSGAPQEFRDRRL